MYNLNRATILFVHQQLKYNNRQAQTHTRTYIRIFTSSTRTGADFAEVHCLKNVRQSAIDFLYFRINSFFILRKKIEVIPETKTIRV